jgi:3'-phosphoadenosine 5'-phosphosulfate sulfotransferase (PAPS reductase)/FAD synthetase
VQTDAALVSGGIESAVAADVSVRWGDADLLIYLDTKTGVRKNRRYIERLADWMGVQLWTMRTHESYIAQVLNHGFPGPTKRQHNMMYRKLKERPIQRLAARVEELHLWTGVRRRESDNRMDVVEIEGSAANDRWFWHAPIANWTTDDCRRYIKQFELPCNPLWDTLGRSGDCYCGCYGSPEEKIDTLAAGCEGRVAYLDALETLADHGNERDRWAHGALSDAEKRAERIDDNQMTLCSSCGLRADGGSR